jgi:hypothetical protein
MRGKLRSVRPPPQGDQVTKDEDDETLAPHTRQAQVCLLLLSFFLLFLSLYDRSALRLSFSLPCLPCCLYCLCYLFSVSSFVSQFACQSLCFSRSVCFCLPVSPRFLSLHLITLSVSLVCRVVFLSVCYLLSVALFVSQSACQSLCLSRSVYFCLPVSPRFLSLHLILITLRLSFSLLVCRIVFIASASCSLSPHLFHSLPVSLSVFLVLFVSLSCQSFFQSFYVSVSILLSVLKSFCIRSSLVLSCCQFISLVVRSAAFEWLSIPIN